VCTTIPSIVPAQQNGGPAINELQVSRRAQAILTMNRRSIVTVEANASANPAKEAEMLGVSKATKAIAPTIPAESRLNRTESHRLT
jgi:hypothetical protein